MGWDVNFTLRMVYRRERSLLLLNRGMAEPQIRSRRFVGDESLLPLPGFELLTVQTVWAVFDFNTSNTYNTSNNSYCTSICLCTAVKITFSPYLFMLWNKFSGLSRSEFNSEIMMSQCLVIFAGQGICPSQGLFILDSPVQRNAHVHSPCFKCRMLSFGLFPCVCSLNAVSEHTVLSS
jgi:hypothetical protein